MRELIVDSFAGGGGASTGIERALGRSPDIAINHDAVALAMHAANHPNTRHLPHNVWKVDPNDVCEGRPVGLLWASPDCKHFSKAKGGRPVEQNIRDLAWVVVRWAKQVAPRVIFLENVEEFQTWGPLGDDKRPCPKRSGQTFQKWVRELRKLGYKVEWRELCAADFGAPTIRKRLFLIARRDGLPIIWPKATHGRPNSLGVINGKLKPWRTAAEIIDWSLPCHSIFLSKEEGREVNVKRPLADNTMARVARGVDRYVINAANPFIVPLTHTGDFRVHSIDEPVRTLTTAQRGEHALVTPFFAPRYLEKDGQEPRVRNALEPAATITGGGHVPGMLIAPTLIQTGYGERPGQDPRVPGLDVPLGTVVAGGCKHAVVAAHLSRQFGASVGSACTDPVGTITAGGGGKTALVSAFLAQHNLARGDGIHSGRDMRQPMSTVLQSGSQQAVVSAGLISLKGTERRGQDVEAPTPAITAGGYHVGEVRAFIMKYHRDGGQAQDCADPLGTGGTKARFGIVTVTIGDEEWELVDIGMRMLSPRELFRAQGFPESYLIDRTADGTPVTKTDQIRMCGNSVCPDVAAALVAANYTEMEVSERGVPEFALAAAE